MASKEQMLRDLLFNIAQEQDYKDATIHIEAITTEGANYTSIPYNATVSARDKEDLKLFAKVGNLDEKSRETLTSDLYDSERSVYRDLANIFKRIEQKAKVPDEHRYVFPKFYGYNPDLYQETVVLENLAAQGYVVYDRMKSVDWPYASKAVETIAKFHALSMAFEEQNPVKFSALEKTFSNNIEPAYRCMSDNCHDYLSKVEQAAREENKGKVIKYFDRIASTDMNLFSKFSKLRRKIVLIHGDFRPSNIMHREKEDESLDLILLDYQTMQGGCPVADLLYFIVTGTDEQFRAKYYQRLIDHYFDNLAQALQRLRLDPKQIYPREDFDSDLQEALPFGLVVAVCLLSLVLVDSEEASESDGSETDIWASLVKPKINPLYVERINGVIDDYVRWGVL